MVLGAVLLSTIKTCLIPDVPQLGSAAKVGLDFDLSKLSIGIFGFLLVVVMVSGPEGLLPERRRSVEPHGGRQAESVLRAAGA